MIDVSETPHQQRKPMAEGKCADDEHPARCSPEVAWRLRDQLPEHLEP